MKKLWTHCPNCKLGFYVDIEGEDEKVEITCPNCNFGYLSRVKKHRIKDVKYNWELNDKLHTGLIFEDENPTHLKFATVFLVSALVLFSIGILSLFVLDTFTMIHQSIGLAGGIFFLIEIVGMINTYNRKSFAVAFTGSFFAILSSLILGFLNSKGDFLIFPQELSFLYAVLTLFLSFLALLLILKNRHSFDIGY